MITLRCGLIIVALIISSAAHANCFLDEKTADLATNVYAYNNACTTQPRYDDNGALEVFVTLGAAAETAKTDSTCRTLIILQTAQASARLQVATQSERRAECAMYRASQDIQAALKRLGRAE